MFAGRRLTIAVGLPAGLVLATGLGVGLFLKDASVQQRIVTALSAHLDADVTIEHLEVDVFPTVRIVASGLRIHRRQDPWQVPPIITADRFEVEPGLWHVLTGRAREVEVDGLRFTIPPKHQAPPAHTSSGPQDASPVADVPRPVISRLIARRAEVVYTPGSLDGQRRAFPIVELELRDVGFDRAMQYRGTVQNPQPKGAVAIAGTFGPFDAHDPGGTPIEGTYALPTGDFNTIAGLTGDVRSDGTLNGTLNQMHVRGTSVVERFQVDNVSAPVTVTMQFDTRVDGTNGNVEVTSMDGRIANTPFRAAGTIMQPPGPGGPDVNVEVKISDGRVEDLLPLAVTSDTPLLAGALTFQGRFELPHGTRPATQRMRVDGTFTVDDARPGDALIAERVNDFSHRAQGAPDGTLPDQAPLSVRGTFRARDGQLHFASLGVSVEGARITLTGTYPLGVGEINMRGQARLDASVRHMADGVKGFLLRLVSPLFSKDGAGAVIPIRVTGPHDQPSVRVEVRRALGIGGARPAGRTPPQID